MEERYGYQETRCWIIFFFRTTRFKKLTVLLGLFACSCLVFSGCTWLVRKPPRVEGSALVKLSNYQHPDFSDDLASDGLSAAIVQSIEYLNRVPDGRLFWFGDDAVTTRQMKASLEHFLAFLETRPAPEDLNGFIKTYYNVYVSKGSEDTEDVLFTGYYEPELSGSLQQTEEFKYPVYSLPDDLVFVELSLFGQEFEGRKRLIGRYTDSRQIVPYYEREEIAWNTLVGRSRPIAWVKDKVGLFFLEIQGSGKICLDSGGCINVHYHTSNGHPYSSIGALLIQQEKIPREEMSMQRIREYLEENPEEVDTILNHNKSMVFFKIEDGGPFGCLNGPRRNHHNARPRNVDHTSQLPESSPVESTRHDSFKGIVCDTYRRGFVGLSGALRCACD